MSRKYFSLLVRDTKDGVWGVHFGDYDRDTVEAEREDITENEYKKSNTKIITTNAGQSAIDAAIAKLNA